MTDMIHVACNIDDRYTKYCCVMLTSLLHNNADCDFHIHIITQHLGEESRRRLTDLVETRYGKTLSFYSPHADSVKHFHVKENSHITIATYFRVFIASLLPADIDKVLYLDCDLVVDGPVTELWNTDISDVTLAGVEDMWSGRPEIYERLGYPQRYSYFNAGVLLLNLAKIRKSDFEQHALRNLIEHPEKYEMNDQDLLNELLHDDKKFLPFRWNVQDGFLRHRRYERMSAESLPGLCDELRNPVIVHYTGGHKPWQYKSIHPMKGRYYHYLDMTEWARERPTVPASFRIKLAVDRALQALRLARPKYLKHPTRL